MSNELVTTSSPSDLLLVALEKNADVDKLEKLMQLQERWEAGQAKQQFYAAFTEFQADLPVIEKKKSGHNMKYAPLSDIIEQIKPFLRQYQLTYRFEQDHSDAIQVTCIVTHAGGHSEQATMKAAADTSGSKNSVQAIGSTVSYLSRYTLCSVLGISTADEDMDGRLPEPDFISESQAEELKGMLKESGADVKKFCSNFGCSAVDLLPEKSYKRAKAMITAKLEAK